MKFLYLLSASFLGILFCMPSFALADHPGPERIVDNKYVVLLHVQPQGEEMQLRFYFRDMKTGKPLQIPISGMVEIKATDTKQPAMENRPFSTEEGKMEMAVLFSEAGAYSVALSFKTTDALEQIHTPEEWGIWIPGKEGAVPPFGLSEWLTVGLGGSIAILVVLSLLQNRRKKSTI